MLKTAVVSSCLGRIRLRHDAFKNTDLTNQIHELEEMHGMAKVEYNSSTGSILLVYKPKLLAEKDIHQSLNTLFTPILSSYQAPIKKSNITLQGVVEKATVHYGKKKTSDFMINAMKTTLIPSVIFSFTGAKRLHVILGSAFLVFAVGHTLMYKQKEK